MNIEDLIKEPMTEEECKLLKENERLIWSRVHVHKHININKFHINELFNQGVFGMLKAIRTYEPEKGKLSVHMYWGIDGAIRNMFKRRKREILSSLEATASDDEDDKLNIGNSSALAVNDEYKDAKVDYKTTIFPLMEKVLTAEELIVLKCLFELGEEYSVSNNQEICDKLRELCNYDCCTANLTHVRRRAMKKLRDALGVIAE